MTRNHIKEAALTAVHRAMENRSSTARQHLAVKAEKYGKEFPFIYRYHEVTDIPDRHAECGDVVVRHVYRAQQHTLIANFCTTAPRGAMAVSDHL